MAEEALEMDAADESTGDMRADFESAISKLGVDNEENAREEPTPPETQAAEKTEEEVPGEGAEQPAAAESAAEPAERQLKPPIDWSIANKQQWQDLPKEIKQQIHDREAGINQALHEAADSRRLADNFNHMVNSYAPVFAAEGVTDPMKGLQGLINVTAELQMGTPTRKAQRIAGLIQHYGVDIQTLDSILAGQPQANPEQANVQSYIDQRLQPINQFLNQVNQGRATQQQQVQYEAHQSVEEFGAQPGNQFFEDVRMAMADFLDMAAQNGQAMTLEQAYDRACAMNPEIATIVAQQRGAEQLQQGQNAVANKQRAASSISSHRPGGGAGGGTMSMRETIEQAWDESAR
jgi:hypothetical protein